MTARLPKPGGDDNTWGDILNSYLSQSLNADGTLKTSAVSATGAEQTANKTTDGTLVANSDTLYPSEKAVKTYADTKQASLGFTAENVAHKDGVNGYAGLDGSGLLKTAELPSSVGSGTSGFANVKAYGAVGDGVTDDTTALNAAYADVAAGLYRGMVIPAGLNCLVSGSGLLMNQNARVIVSGYGATITPAANSVGITYDTGVMGGGALGSVIEGLLFRPQGTQTQTCIKMRNSYRLALRDLNLYSGSVGILISNDGAGGSSEDNHFENIYIAAAATGIKFELINGADGSLEENSFYHVSIAGCTKGIWQGPGLEFRSVMMHSVKLWATNPGSQTCLYLEGDITDWVAQLHLEDLSGSGNTAIHFTSTATSPNLAHVDLATIGVFATNCQIDYASTFGFIYRQGNRTVWAGKLGAPGLSARRDTDTQDRFQLQANPAGINLGAGGATAPDTNLYRSAANVLKTDDRLIAADSVTLKTKAGAIADTDFQVTPDDGTVALDTTAGLMVRSGGVWGYVSGSSLSLGGLSTEASPGNRQAAVPPTNVLLESVPGRFGVAATLTITSGTLMCACLVNLRKDVTYSKITFYSGGTGATTVTHQQAGLVRTTDNQVLAITEDRTSEAWGANTAKTFTLASAYTPSSDVAVWLGLVIVFTSAFNLRAIVVDATLAAITPVSMGASSTGLTAFPAVSTAVTTPSATGLNDIAYATLS